MDVDGVYPAADPQNRLVTDELERRWNQAFAHVREIEQRIADHDGTKPSAPTPDLVDFTALAERLEVLWEHPDTDPRLKLTGAAERFQRESRSASLNTW